MLKKFLTCIVIVTTLLSLQSLVIGCKNTDDSELEDLLTEGSEYQAPVINEDAINELIGSFSSPVEMAALMSSLEVPFSKKYLIDPTVTEDYDLNNKKAFALGVLSADLGYLNVYERSTLIVEYLSAIKRLSDDLKVSQFFDFSSFKRIATSNDNIDSLLFLSVQSFRQMDEYLRESSKSNLSLLIISGVWLEGLYLLTQVADQESNQQLIDRIGEQKVLFNMLYPVLKIYSDDPYFENFVTELQGLQNIFEEISITYEKGDPETVVLDGHVTIIQHETSIIEITDEQLKQIILQTKKIRSKQINL